MPVRPGPLPPMSLRGYFLKHDRTDNSCLLRDQAHLVKAKSHSKKCERCQHKWMVFDIFHLRSIILQVLITVGAVSFWIPSVCFANLTGNIFRRFHFSSPHQACRVHYPRSLSISIFLLPYVESHSASTNLC